MDPARWRQVNSLLRSALERKPDERSAFLAESCGEDQALRDELESLLEHYQETGAFLEVPALNLAAAEQGSLAGKTFGPYEVRAMLGSGGMGDVYRACDARLKREVAIKVLPGEFSGDPERVARFQREAQVLASLNRPIYRISAAGGQPAQLTQPEQGTSHRFPQFLPDGRHFLYYVQGIRQIGGVVYVGQLDATEPRRLVDADGAGVYLSPGKLLFIRQRTMFAQDFDAVRLALSGNPFPVAEQVAVNMAFGSAAVSASATGLLAYRAGPAERRQFTWFDRSGREIAKAAGPDSADASGLSISSDGRYVAFERVVDANRDIWLLETARGVLRRLTFDPANDVSPIWSPDGSRIVFISNREGVGNLYQKLTSDAGDEERLLSLPLSTQLADWSPDRRFLLYRTQDAKTKYDIWALPLEREGKPFPIVQTNFDERDAQFSTDGKWIAYESDESGRFEIYVQPFPGPGAKLPISTNGGAQVRWARDGRELFYIGLDERLMAVPIRLPAKDQAVEIGVPVPLFPTRVGGAVTVRKQQYIVSPDGQQFLINTVLDLSVKRRLPKGYFHETERAGESLETLSGGNDAVAESGLAD